MEVIHFNTTVITKSALGLKPVGQGSAPTLHKHKHMKQSDLKHCVLSLMAGCLLPFRKTFGMIPRKTDYYYYYYYYHHHNNHHHYYYFNTC
jgi:hypothetical protein